MTGASLFLTVLVDQYIRQHEAEQVAKLKEQVR